MTDITETKNVEATLRTVNEELEAFSYSVSHDLRSPLNKIDGFSVLLAKKLSGSDNAKALHYLSRIRVSTAQMAQLIADLLSLAQIARTKIAYQPVDLSALAGLVVLDLQAGRPEQQVVVHIDSGLGLWGDAGLLRVVLQNLLGNAWKYSSKRTHAVISVGRTLNAAGRSVFFVKDNGAGFDMAHAEKLFQPFQRLHEEAEFTGTGIGLATVSRIIMRHGGRIWAESAPGAGATFFFTLPAGPAEV
jgi:light-regulated signal transduction histidine kinase (bacteriophytochrome)